MELLLRLELDDLGGQGSESGTEDGSITNEAQDAAQFNVFDKSYWMFKRNSLARELNRGQITAIGFSGTIGIGLFVTSGELIAISGSLGGVLAFIFAGVIIIGVMRSLAEMVSVRPLSGALMDYPHTYVDEALGFAVGVTYWLAQCLSMATLTSFAARASDTFQEQPLSKGKKAGIIVGLCCLTLVSNICGVTTYGNIERVVKWLKLSLIIGLCVLMIGVNLGMALGPSAPTGGGNYTHNSLPPYLRWTGFGDEKDTLEPPEGLGIKGGWGQFLGIWTSVIYAMFACIGGDIIIVTAGEAKNPHRDLPAATRFMYMAPIGFYVLLTFVLGFNINYFNKDLFHIWANDNENISHSPFIIVMKHTSVKVLPNFLNACFRFSAYSAANTGLYTSSRTLFALSRLYGNRFMRDTLHLGKTNPGNTPTPAILVCSVFGFLAFLCFADESFNQPILSLSAFFTGAVACVYASECVAYLRFKRGLTLHQKSKAKLIIRDSAAYKAKHYRAHWQPFCAWVGLVGCIAIIIFSGWPAIHLLRTWDSLTERDKLKSKGSLGADVAGAYAGPLVFFTLYFGYKLIKNTKIKRFPQFKDSYFPPGFRTYVPPMQEYDRPLWRYGLRRAVYNAKKLLSSKVRRGPLPGQRRINWTCSCGIKLYADLDNVDSTTDLEFDLQSLQNGSESPGSFRLQPLSYPGASLARSSSSTGAFGSQVQSSSRSNSGLNMRSTSHQRWGNASQDRDSRKRWLELSMPRAKYTIELNEIETSAARRDGELFDRIRSAYSTSKIAAGINPGHVSAWGKLRRLLSWARISKPCGVEFIRFRIDARPLIGKLASPSLPPVEEVTTGRYIYTPCPLNSTPIPNHIFMHYLTTPSSMHQHSIWGPRMPQKLGAGLLASTEPSPEGWGIHILEGPNWLLIVSFTIGFAIVGVIAAAIYSYCTGDSQTGMAIAAYLAALQSLGLALYVVNAN